MALQYFTDTSEKKWLNLGPENLYVYNGSTINGATFTNFIDMQGNNIINIGNITGNTGTTFNSNITVIPPAKIITDTVEAYDSNGLSLISADTTKSIVLNNVNTTVNSNAIINPLFTLFTDKIQSVDINGLSFISADTTKSIVLNNSNTTVNSNAIINPLFTLFADTIQSVDTNGLNIRSFSNNNVLSITNSGISVTKLLSANDIVITPPFELITNGVQASNSSGLVLYSSTGTNTVEINDLAISVNNAYNLPLVAGVSGQVLTMQTSPTVVWQTPIPPTPSYITAYGCAIFNQGSHGSDYNFAISGFGMAQASFFRTDGIVSGLQFEAGGNGLKIPVGFAGNYLMNLTMSYYVPSGQTLPLGQDLITNFGFLTSIIGTARAEITTATIVEVTQTVSLTCIANLPDGEDVQIVMSQGFTGSSFQIAVTYWNLTITSLTSQP